jgi:hypothetical protein
MRKWAFRRDAIRPNAIRPNVFAPLKTALMLKYGLQLVEENFALFVAVTKKAKDCHYKGKSWQQGRTYLDILATP